MVNLKESLPGVRSEEFGWEWTGEDDDRGGLTAVLAFLSFFLSLSIIVIVILIKLATHS